MQTGREIAAKFLRKYKPSIFDSGIGARLPAEYRKFYDEWRKPATPVNYLPEPPDKWVKDEETGEMKRVLHRPLPNFYVKELNDVFLGGENIIRGWQQRALKKKKKIKYEVPYFWVPELYRSVVYSEILDKYISVIMTMRLVDLIHKHQGFDAYLLETSACDLQTNVALKLKRKLLYALMDKQLPYDEEKNEAIYEKYKHHLLPPEELEWYGLNFTEACQKQTEIEKAEKEASMVPLKHLFRAKYIEELKSSNEK